MKLDRSVIYRVVGRPGRDDRPALPAGHPVSWSVLTDGTVLHGSKHPNPPIEDKRDDEKHRQMIVVGLAPRPE